MIPVFDSVHPFLLHEELEYVSVDFARFLGIESDYATADFRRIQENCMLQGIYVFADQYQVDYEEYAVCCIDPAVAVLQKMTKEKRCHAICMVLRKLRVEYEHAVLEAAVKFQKIVDCPLIIAFDYDSLPDSWLDTMKLLKQGKHDLSRTVFMGITATLSNRPALEVLCSEGIRLVFPDFSRPVFRNFAELEEWAFTVKMLSKAWKDNIMI